MLMRDEKGRHARSCACALGRGAGERKENTPGHLRQVFVSRGRFCDTPMK